MVEHGHSSAPQLELFGNASAGLDTDAATLSGNVFEMRVAQATPPGARHSGERGQTDTQQSNRPPLNRDNPDRREFANLIDQLIADPSKYPTLANTIGQKIDAADHRTDQTLAQARKDMPPGYPQANQRLQSANRDGNAAIDLFTDKYERRGVQADLSAYFKNPNAQTQAKLLAHGPLAQGVLTAAQHTLDALKDPTYVKGQAVLTKVAGAVADSVMFRNAYAEVLADDVHDSGLALQLIFDSNGIQRMFDWHD